MRKLYIILISFMLLSSNLLGFKDSKEFHVKFRQGHSIIDTEFANNKENLLGVINLLNFANGDSLFTISKVIFTASA